VLYFITIDHYINWIQEGSCKTNSNSSTKDCHRKEEDIINQGIWKIDLKRDLFYLADLFNLYWYVITYMEVKSDKINFYFSVATKYTLPEYW